MADHLADGAVAAMARRITEGSTFSIVWAVASDPDTRINWKCTARSKPRDDVVVFVSQDADDEAEEYWLPEAAQPDVDIDEDSRVVYYDVVIPERHARKSMARSCKRSMMASAVVAWKPSTWTQFLNMEGTSRPLGREILVGQLRTQLGLPDRVNMHQFKSNTEHELCTLGEALIAMVDLLQTMSPDDQMSPQVQAVLTPILRRLCEHRAAVGKEGPAKTASMDAIRSVFLSEDLKGDKITLAMMGVNHSQSAKKEK